MKVRIRKNIHHRGTEHTEIQMLERFFSVTPCLCGEQAFVTGMACPDAAAQLPRDGQEKISTKPPRPPSIQVSSGALPSMVTAVGSA